MAAQQKPIFDSNGTPAMLNTRNGGVWVTVGRLDLDAGRATVHVCAPCPAFLKWGDRFTAPWIALQLKPRRSGRLAVGEEAVLTEDDGEREHVVLLEEYGSDFYICTSYLRNSPFGFGDAFIAPRCNLAPAVSLSVVK